MSLLKSQAVPLGEEDSEDSENDGEENKKASEVDETPATHALSSALANDTSEEASTLSTPDSGLSSYSDEPSPLDAEESLRKFREEMIVSLACPY